MTLIDTGPSPRGWHRLESYLRCPRLFQLGYGRSGESPELAEANATRFPPTYPLVRGTIAHVGLAHLYRRLQCSQGGEDPEAYYRPSEALPIVAEKWGELGKEAMTTVPPLLAAYIARYAGAQPKVIGVEMLLSMDFSGQDSISARGDWTRTSYPYTARADLVYRDRDGKVRIIDHKCVSRIESKSLTRYTLSGQFLGLTHLGFAHWGEEFGGVVVNLLGEKDHAFLREKIPPAPWALEAFPRVVVETERAIERGVFTPTLSEFTCMTPYSRCPAWELCRWGEDHG